MKKSIVRNMIIAGAVVFQLGCSSSEQNTDKTISAQDTAERPNVLLIVADDLGYSDLGAFGGEIETPNLDALAMSGVRLTSFYAMPNCSPTRSMLLTGKDNHSVGLGVMAEALRSFPMLQGKPGYEGYLHPETTTIAEKFSEAGYRTLMTGKWHLGRKPEHQPPNHGFDKSFVLLEGGADHFGFGQNGGPALDSATYTEDGDPAQFPVGVYSSDFYAERMIDYLSSESGAQKPFFAYLAFTAPHWPLQAPKELIAKYEGQYDTGPSALREARLKRMKALGLLSDEALAAILRPLDNWEELSPNERKIESRKMEIYAAMVDSLDQNVGKVLDHLRSTGELDNTIIIFLSDNGAEGIGLRPLIARSSNSTPAQHKEQVLATVNAANSDLELMGTSDSYLTYGRQWAQAATAPFRQYKGDTEEGGIRTPAFISGPGVVGQRIINAPLSVRDVMPTALELTGVSEGPKRPVTQSDKLEIILPEGKSWGPILNGSADSVRDENDTMAWELFLKRAVRLGDWKAVYGKSADAAPGDRRAPSSWRLYNLASDPGESTDVKEQNPEVFERLMTAWDIYAEENGVFVPGPKPAAQ